MVPFLESITQQKSQSPPLPNNPEKLFKSNLITLLSRVLKLVTELSHSTVNIAHSKSTPSDI